MIYATKYRLVNMALPVLVVGAFGLIGVRATHGMFAQSLPTPTLVLTTPKTQYHTGEEIVVMLSNTSAVNAYVLNNCPNEPLSVSRMTSTGWEAVHASAPITKCAGEPRDYEIPADRSIPVHYSDWQSLFSTPGTYRIQAVIESSQQEPTVQFTVTQ